MTELSRAQLVLSANYSDSMISRGIYISFSANKAAK